MRPAYRTIRLVAAIGKATTATTMRQRGVLIAALSSVVLLRAHRRFVGPRDLTEPTSRLGRDT
jgi:hypothetical protein